MAKNTPLPFKIKAGDFVTIEVPVTVYEKRLFKVCEKQGRDFIVEQQNVEHPFRCRMNVTTMHNSMAELNGITRRKFFEDSPLYPHITPKE